MSGIVHTMPGTATAATSMSMSAPKPKDDEFPLAVEEMCEYLGRRDLAAHYNGEPLHKVHSYGVEWGRRQLAKQLTNYKHHLSQFMREYPREEGQSIDDHFKRLCMTGKREVGHVLNMTALIAAHIMRIEDEEDDARRKAEVERKALEAYQRAELVKQSAPDRDEVRRLYEAIDDAKDGEAFLAKIAAALNAHRAAEEARKRLSDIFDSERSACATLGKKAKSHPKVPEAPQGALDLAQTVRLANAPAARVYLDDKAKAKSSLRGF